MKFTLSLMKKVDTAALVIMCIQLTIALVFIFGICFKYFLTRIFEKHMKHLETSQITEHQTPTASKEKIETENTASNHETSNDSVTSTQAKNKTRVNKLKPVFIVLLVILSTLLILQLSIGIGMNINKRLGNKNKPIIGRIFTMTNVLSRFIIVLLFSLRLKDAFAGSSFSINPILIIVIITIDVAASIMAIIADFRQFHTWFTMEIQVKLFLSYYIIDVIMNFVIVISFVSRLQKLIVVSSINKATEKDDVFEKIAYKMSYLSIIVTISASIMIVWSELIFKIDFGWIGVSYPLTSLDCLINLFSAFLSFGYSSQIYNKICAKPQNCCIKVFCFCIV